MTSDSDSPIAAISAAMLKVFAATSRDTSSSTSPARRQLLHIGGEALAGHPADMALTNWMAIMKGVVRNTVQSRP